MTEEHKGWDKPPLEYEDWLDEMMMYASGSRKTFARYLATVAVDRKLLGAEQRFLLDFIERPTVKWKSSAKSPDKGKLGIRNNKILVAYMEKVQTLSPPEARGELAEQFHLSESRIYDIVRILDLPPK
ncbi:MAG TPA: hypothetical protein VET88_06515 [Gammaproteobacteria bacterium]|nr:hypothetical protein [Gammaproteobacteria bacterium]